MFGWYCSCFSPTQLKAAFKAFYSQFPEVQGFTPGKDTAFTSLETKSHVEHNGNSVGSSAWLCLSFSSVPTSNKCDLSCVVFPVSNFTISFTLFECLGGRNKKAGEGKHRHERGVCSQGSQHSARHKASTPTVHGISWATLAQSGIILSPAGYKYLKG